MSKNISVLYNNSDLKTQGGHSAWTKKYVEPAFFSCTDEFEDFLI